MSAWHSYDKFLLYSGSEIYVIIKSLMIDFLIYKCYPFFYENLFIAFKMHIPSSSKQLFISSNNYYSVC